MKPNKRQELASDDTNLQSILGMSNELTPVHNNETKKNEPIHWSSGQIMVDRDKEESISEFVILPFTETPDI